MYQARYYKSDGSQGSEVSLPTALFDGVVNEPALHQVVKAYLSNQRQGTAAGKSRGQVRGGSRKPWRQKGTGRARQGTIRAAQWVGGGLAFPPQPHSWRERVPKRVRALARRSAFNSRAEAGRVVVIEGLDFEAPKTRQLTNLLSSMDTDGKVLILTNGVKSNVHLSGRNLPGVQVLPFGDESPYHVIWSGTVIIEEGALDGVTESPKSSRPRRRPLDREALAAEAEEQAARRRAREARPHKSRRVKGDDIDTTPLATAAPAAPPAPKAKPAVKEEAAPAPVEEEPAAEAAPPVEAAPEAEVDTASEAEAAPEAEAAAPEAEEAPDASDEGSAAGGIDVESVALPKISDLKAFLADVDNADDVRTLMGRDTRKTAGPHYEARIAELEEDS